MELWGGIECTINRVGDDWHDQLALSGHAQRIADLESIADLGIRTLRYPVLWEATAPDSAAALDWQWTDARLARLRALKISPILGLLHHGSGPRYTSLVDDSFAAGLADFAGRVASRYPWVERFTPVNEPLTTARFSGLYGHWYPHGRDARCFARAFINQCRATVLAMQAIRCWNPEAKLVQTEDLGTTYSTPRLAYQRDFDNERRWLTWDVLCGRMERRHPLYSFLTGSGISAAELGWFVDNPCPPDVIGINHYVTSDRYLDERTTRYASQFIGGNCNERYADIEAVRVLGGAYRGFRVLRETWERYHLPIAVTEVHLGCSREEQMRWLLNAWHAARDAFEAGCHVRAVTAWALFGTFNWDTLLTGDGSYEPGAFDVRSAKPRPTALARLIRELNAGCPVTQCAARGSGWWQRESKVLYGDAAQASSLVALRRTDSEPRPLLICGGGGSLATALARACAERGLPCRAVDRSELDVCDLDAARRLLAEVQPWALINAAGFVHVDEAEQRSAQCFRENATGAGILMDAARDHDIPFVSFSSDLVFDGAAEVPYVESNSTAPLNVYGRSKDAAERAVLRYHRTLCIRTAAFFGCGKRGDFLSHALQTLAAGRPFYAAADVIVSPTYVPDLASACLDLLIDGERGIFHLANLGSVSWAELARLAAAASSVDCRGLHPRPFHELGWKAPRPLFSALRSERASLMPTLESALLRYAIASGSEFSSAKTLKSGTS